MSNKYVVKGIKKEQIMDSLVRIHVGNDGKIEKVEDKWNGKLPDGAISEVSDSPNAMAISIGVFLNKGLLETPISEQRVKMLTSMIGFPEAQRSDCPSVCQGAEDGGGGLEDEG